MTQLVATVKIDLSALKKYEREIDSGLNQQATNPVAVAIKQWGVRYRSFAQRRFNTYSRGGGDWKPLSDRTKLARRGGGQRIKRFKAKRFKAGGSKMIPSRAGKRGAKTNKLKRAVAAAKKNPFSLSRIKKVYNAKAKLSKHRAGNKGTKTAAKRKKFKRTEAARKREFFKKRKASLKKLKQSILRDLGLLFNVLSAVFQGAPGALEERILYGIRVGYGGASRHKGSRATIADIAEFHDKGMGHNPKRQIIVNPPDNVLAMMAKDMDRALVKLAEQVTTPDIPIT